MAVILFRFFKKNRASRLTIAVLHRRSDWPILIKKITKEREKAVVKLKEIENQLNTQKAEIIKLQQKHEELYRESIQQKIEIMWLKNGKVSSDQIEKFLELCGHLQDRINDLSINEILDAISLVSEEKAENK